jgi:predicted MFS family arabinose efflux permease
MNTVPEPPIGKSVPPPGKERPSARAWLAVGSVALGAFIIVTTEFIPVGLLPLMAGSLHVPLGLAGLMVVVPGLSAAVSAPLIFAGARQADRRKLILTLGGLVAISNAVASIAPDFGVVLLGRVLLGVAIAGFWTVVTPVGPKLVGPRAGTRAISFIVAGVSAGTVIGLPAGQALGNLLGWRLTFATAAAAGLVIVAAQLALLPSITADGRTRLRDLGGVFRIPSARAGLIATAIVFTGQFAASTYITPLLTEHARMSAPAVTALFFGYGTAGIIGTLIAGRLVARSRAGTFAGAALAVGAALIALPRLSAVHLAEGIVIVAWGLIWGVIPLAAQVWMLRSDPGAQEAASAANVSNMQISIAAGSALGGLLVDAAGLVTVYTVAGSIALASAVFALIAGRREPAGRHSDPAGPRGALARAPLPRPERAGLASGPQCGTCHSGRAGLPGYSRGPG